jgi:hypothetical protein
MTGTISGNVTIGYTLSVNPTTILDTGSVAVTTGNAIYGRTATAWSESGRNRPGRYGSARPAGTLAARLAELGRSGLDPGEVAAQVVAAIRTDELYMFTHPEMRAEAADRFAATLAAMDKAAAR